MKGVPERETPGGFGSNDTSEPESVHCASRCAGNATRKPTIATAAVAATMRDAGKRSDFRAAFVRVIRVLISGGTNNPPGGRGNPNLILSPTASYVQPAATFTGRGETPVRSVPGAGHLSEKKRTAEKKKGGRPKPPAREKPGKETLREDRENAGPAGNDRSNRRGVRLALELVVQAGSRVADAE